MGLAFVTPISNILTTTSEYRSITYGTIKIFSEVDGIAASSKETGSY
jgi:hypothetical protein